MQRAGASMADVFASIEKAERACKQAGLDTLRTEYEQPKPHDMSQATDEDKRTTYARAKAGQMGEQWRRIAQREQIGVFLELYENWREAPTDDDLARMWPDWKP